MSRKCYHGKVIQKRSHQNYFTWDLEIRYRDNNICTLDNKAPPQRVYASKCYFFKQVVTIIISFLPFSEVFAHTVITSLKVSHILT